MRLRPKTKAVKKGSTSKRWVYMCSCEGVYMFTRGWSHLCVLMHVGIRGQAWLSEGQEIGSFTGSELTKQARLASQWVPASTSPELGWQRSTIMLSNCYVGSGHWHLVFMFTRRTLYHQSCLPSLQAITAMSREQSLFFLVLFSLASKLSMYFLCRKKRCSEVLFSPVGETCRGH